MKLMILLLTALLMTACGGVEDMTKSTEIMTGERNAAAAPQDAQDAIIEIMNFRTSDSMEMENETRIIRTFEDFKAYNAAYTIIENPFFIDDFSLNRLQKVGDDFFAKQGLVVVVLVESSGSNTVAGDNLVIKENVAEAFITRTEPGIGTMDIATRHVVYVVSQEALKSVDEVKVTFSVHK